MQFLFTDHTLDTDRRELRRGGEPIDVEPQVLDVLIYLVENRERVVSKDDLIASVWAGRIVSDATLSSRIYAARKALGDTGQDQKLIRTIPRKGHRFIGAVSTPSKGDEPAAPATGPPLDGLHERSRSALPLPDRPAIAVLPFVNMSDDPEQEYFSDGISEDLITALSKLRWFFVIARNSSFAFKGKAVHIKQVGEELGVGYVIEGSVRKDGDRVRITAQLNDVATGSHVWAERYDRRARRRVRGAGRDHRGDRRLDRAAALRYGEFPLPAQRPGKPGRLGSGDAGAVPFLAYDSTGQYRRPGALGKGDCDRSELRPGARRPCLQPCHLRVQRLG